MRNSTSDEIKPCNFEMVNWVKLDEVPDEYLNVFLDEGICNRAGTLQQFVTHFHQLLTDVTAGLVDDLDEQLMGNHLNRLKPRVRTIFVTESEVEILQFNTCRGLPNTSPPTLSASHFNTTFSHKRTMSININVSYNILLYTDYLSTCMHLSKKKFSGMFLHRLSMGGDV